MDMSQLTSLDRLIEESAEVIHAACKVIRFGPDKHWDKENTTNIKALFNEIEQLEEKIAIVKKEF